MEKMSARIMVPMPPELAERIRRAADRRYTKTTHIMRLAVAEWLDQEDQRLRREKAPE
jgi:Arc/MetJ-type ribon-helix-helix transcriptional regulator